MSAAEFLEENRKAAKKMSPESTIEKFRAVAALSLADLKARHDEDLVSWLNVFVQDQLIGVALPSIDTPESFAEAIKMLADNKRAWSRRLGMLILDQVDSQSPEERAAAGEQLREFSATCPWQFLRLSAAGKIE